jgi:hypothetical protein
MIAAALLLLLNVGAVHQPPAAEPIRPRGYPACMRGAFMPEGDNPPLKVQLRAAMVVCADERAELLRLAKQDLSQLHPEWSPQQVAAEAERALAQWEARILYFETERLRERTSAR